MSDERPVALVTGSRKGIGRHLAGHLLTRGYRVVGCSRKPVDWQAEDYIHVIADVADEKQVKSLMRHISQVHGRLDALLNNAGNASMNHSMLTPGETVTRLMETNLLGTFLASREAAKLMQKRHFGRIVNFSSVAVAMRLAGQAAYVAAKGAVECLSQVMARELADFGITVNVVGPPPISTDMIKGVPADKIERLIASMPIKRLGTFEDVANVVDFLLRPESNAVTAQVIYLGGVPNT